MSLLQRSTTVITYQHHTTQGHPTMTTMIDSSELKAIEVNRLAATIGDARLDATAAISLAFDAVQDFYDPESHWFLGGREFLKKTVPERFMFIKNAGVAVKAAEILMAERSAR